MALTLESLHGRVGDVDSHEFMPIGNYPEHFGEIGRYFLDKKVAIRAMNGMATRENPDAFPNPTPDDMEITQEVVWTKKGALAPGATDMDRRPALMDAMGIRRQLVFPGFGLSALFQALGGGQAGVPISTPEEIVRGWEGVNAHNVWAGKFTQKYKDRISVVGMMQTGEPGLTLEALLKRTQGVIELGVKAIQISATELPAGLSPADPKLDPWYELFAQTDTALVFHPPSGVGFRKTDEWDMHMPGGLSVPISFHQGIENFCATLLMGAVFERHPRLRVGFIETACDWIGPLVDRIEFGLGAKAWDSKRFSMKPAEYLARNVRVSALLEERVELWLERWPQLQDVYCWSSDYPHFEGEPWALREAYKRVAPLGDDVVEKFFCTNSELLFDRN